MQSTPAMLAMTAAGNVKAAAKETASDGESTDQAVEAPRRPVVVPPRLQVAMATAPKPRKVQ